jgi:hypothetical protein
LGLTNVDTKHVFLYLLISHFVVSCIDPEVNSLRVGTKCS